MVLKTFDFPGRSWRAVEAGSVRDGREAAVAQVLAPSERTAGGECDGVTARRATRERKSSRVEGIGGDLS